MWYVSGQVKRIGLVVFMIAVSIFGVILVHKAFMSAQSEQNYARAFYEAMGVVVSACALIAIAERYRDYVDRDYVVDKDEMFKFYSLKKPEDVSKLEWENWLWVVEVIARWRVETGRYHTCLTKKDIDDIKLWMVARDHDALLAFKK